MRSGRATRSRRSLKLGRVQPKNSHVPLLSLTRSYLLQSVLWCKILKMPKWRNGRRERLKIAYRKVCGFKSHLRHRIQKKVSIETFFCMRCRRESDLRHFRVGLEARSYVFVATKTSERRAASFLSDDERKLVASPTFGTT